MAIWRSEETISSAPGYLSERRSFLCTHSGKVLGERFLAFDRVIKVNDIFTSEEKKPDVFESEFRDSSHAEL